VLREADGKSERAIFIIDARGIIRYIDVHEIDNQPSNEVLFAELQQIDPSGKRIAPPLNEAPLPHGGIVLYCTPWCGDCRRARNWLAEHGFAYTEVDISRDPRAKAQVRAWANGNETTPTFDIDGTILVDFKPDLLAEALKVR
jgi:glutaredoxin